MMRNDFKLLKRLYPFTKGYRIPFWLSVFSNPLQWIAAVFSSSFGFEKMLDALRLMDGNQFRNGFLLYAAGLGISVVIRGFSVYWLRNASAGIQNNIRQDLMDVYLRQRLTGDTGIHSGELLSVNDQDTESAADVLSTHLVNMITPVIVSIVCIIAIVFRNWVVALVELVTMAVVFCMHRRYEPLYREIGGKIQQSLADLSSAFQDNIAAAFVIRVFSLQGFIKARTTACIDDYYHHNMAEAKMKTKHRAAVNFLFYSSVTIPFLVSAVFVAYGKMTFASIVYITQLANNLLGFSSGLANTIAQYQRSLSSVDRVFALLDTDVEELAGPSVPLAAEGEGQPLLSLENISAAYGKKEVLHSVSLEIQRNQKIAIIGESGSGKSTLAKVLLSFVKFDGTIKYGGKTLSSGEMPALRGLISYVPQGAPLFQTSIYQNILYGKEASGRDGVYQAAAQSGADLFISKLPDGYDTLAGERDMFLSGGQCQKIAISRSILKDAPIVLLDEATSALDNESANAVQDYLSKLENRTVIMITHNLAEIQKADRIYVMSRGEIIEQGTHSYLLENGEAYQRLLKKMEAPSNQS